MWQMTDKIQAPPPPEQLIGAFTIFLKVIDSATSADLAGRLFLYVVLHKY